jgi:hypothetical protein
MLSITAAISPIRADARPRLERLRPKRSIVSSRFDYLVAGARAGSEPKNQLNRKAAASAISIAAVGAVVLAATCRSPANR